MAARHSRRFQHSLECLGCVERVQRGAVVTPARVAVREHERKLECVLVFGLSQRCAGHADSIGQRLRRQWLRASRGEKWA